MAIWWRGPAWREVYHAFDFVSWRWIIVAAALNLFSVFSRALSWNTTIRQALPLPHPPFGQVFSAFAVGLLGNAVFPARPVSWLGSRRCDGTSHGPGTSAIPRRDRVRAPAVRLLPGLDPRRLRSAHREGAHWAVSGLGVLGVSSGSRCSPWQRSRRGVRGSRPTSTRSVPSAGCSTMAREGLAVLRTFPAAFAAILFQTAGWACQLLAVWAVTKAFAMDVPLPAAALVLLLMNVATVFPLWPGNIGLLQAAVAFPLGRYGVAYSTGFAFGLVLQALEMSVGVGVGLVFLAREGLSFASLRKMEDRTEASVESVLESEPAPPVEV